MKDSSTIEIVHKDVVIIGNGPSGIALSYMLSGNLPYLISDSHPDELLSARLKSAKDKCLIHQNLVELAEGLEGRSTNPVSLLLDSLQHPCADMGMEIEPLIEWRQDGVEIDHVVLGKGPPGGSWHSMDPNILTLSLGSWMSLPGLPYKTSTGDSKSRATAGNVANYYLKYVNEMNLAENFTSGLYVTSVKSCKTMSSSRDSIDDIFGELCDDNSEDKENTQKNWVTRLECDLIERPKLCAQPELSSNVDNNIAGGLVKRRSCSISNALSSCIRLKGKRKDKTFRCCKKSRELLAKNEQRTDRKVCEIVDRSLFLTEDKTNYDETNSFRHHSSQSLQLKDENSYILNSKPFFKSLDCVDFDFCELNFLHLHNCYSLNSSLALNQCEHKVPINNCYHQVNLNPKALWLVEGYNTTTGAKFIFTCNNLVLANGSSDLPNRISTAVNPVWLLHDLRTLEQELDKIEEDKKANVDPVLIVGAGLSAADAVVATRLRHIPVLHAFRHKSADLGKQLPENMYPEYHKVHEMMQNSNSSYPLYTSLPECEIADISESSKIVTLLNNSSGHLMKYKVSFVVVLIGSKPDLTFLPSTCSIGVQKAGTIDCKSNPIDLDKGNYSVNDKNGLYALGPLAGDNFVRFIPGGALAIVSDLYKKNDY